MRTYWLIGENKSRRRVATPVGSACLKRRSFPRRRRTDLLKMSSLPTIKQPCSLDKHVNEVNFITYHLLLISRSGDRNTISYCNDSVIERFCFSVSRRNWYISQQRRIVDYRRPGGLQKSWDISWPLIIPFLLPFLSPASDWRAGHSTPSAPSLRHFLPSPVCVLFNQSINQFYF